jgi:hypothetical protein
MMLLPRAKLAVTRTRASLGTVSQPIPRTKSKVYSRDVDAVLSLVRDTHHDAIFHQIFTPPTPELLKVLIGVLARYSDMARKKLSETHRLQHLWIPDGRMEVVVSIYRLMLANNHDTAPLLAKLTISELLDHHTHCQVLRYEELMEPIEKMLIHVICKVIYPVVERLSEVASKMLSIIPPVADAFAKDILKHVVCVSEEDMDYYRQVAEIPGLGPAIHNAIQYELTTLVFKSIAWYGTRTEEVY